MKKLKYVSELIRLEEVGKWSNGDVVTIEAGTGLGKTQFIKTSLLNIAENQDKKILFLTNRRSTREKEEKDVKNNSSIDIESYQKLTSQILEQKEDYLKGYDYVVLDECHFFFTDATFNHTTDIVFKCILDNIDSYALILMSATIQMVKAFLKYNKKFKEYYQLKDVDYTIEFHKQLKNKYEYKADNNYDRIDIKFYRTQKSIERILYQIEGKVLYFCDKTKTAIELRNKYLNSSFICSQSNRNYSISNKKEYDNIIEHERFNAKYLFTTKVLDNGINIKDAELKNIVIETDEPDEIIQMTGRKRFDYQDDNDRLTIYVKLPTRKSCKATYNSIIKYAQIPYIIRNKSEEEFNDWQFKNNHGYMHSLVFRDKKGIPQINYLLYVRLRWISDIMLTIGIDDKTTKIDSTGNVLEMKGDEEINTYRQIRIYNEKNFMDLVCKWFGKGTENNDIIVDDYEDFNIITEYLNKNVGVKMFKAEQDGFKRFVNNNIIKVIKGSHGSLGYNTINSRFEDLGLDFRTTSGEEKGIKSGNRGKRYWIIKKLTS